jgi:transcriptional regulator PpsR
MNIASPFAVPLRAPKETLGRLDVSDGARLIAAAGDISLIIDQSGVVIDLATATGDLSIDGSNDWVGKRWVDVVTMESKQKVEDMLAAVVNGTGARWRQVNHPSSSGDVPVRYWTVPIGTEGRAVAIGRDLRSTAILQQRLLQVQQSLERDYLRLRQAEARYRVLFEQAHEAVLVVDAATRRVKEVNPAAARLLGAPVASLLNKSIASFAAEATQEGVIAYFGAVGAADQPPYLLALPGGRGTVTMSASLFRQDQLSLFLVRLQASDIVDDPRDAAVLGMLARMPDAFVLTDANMTIISANPAFVDAVHAQSVERVQGARLSMFIGRAGIDIDLIVAQVREHGVVRNVATVLRAADEQFEDIELSAVVVPGPDGECFGFTIRAISRRLRDLPPAPRDLPRSVEQLTELVGRVSLKDIVRESTDLIERLCIEAALVHTSDNRASAAEVLGLSRQSLYSKMHRHGLGNLPGYGE